VLLLPFPLCHGGHCIMPGHTANALAGTWARGAALGLPVTLPAAPCLLLRLPGRWPWQKQQEVFLQELCRGKAENSVSQWLLPISLL